MRYLRQALYLSVSLVVASPAFAALTFAQVVDQKIVPIVDKGVIPLLYALAFLFFVVGVVRYFFFSSSEENRQNARAFIIWSLIGMVMLFGIWGVVRVALSIIPGA